MTGDTADAGAPPTMSGVPCDTLEYGQWTGCVQHARAPAVGAAAPPGGGRGLPDRPSRGPAPCCPSQLRPGTWPCARPESWPAARRRSGAQDIPEMGINSPHLGFTVPANNKVLVTPTRDSPLWPPYFRQTAAGILGRAPHRAPAVFFARPNGRGGKDRRGSLLFSPVLRYGAPSPARRFPMVWTPMTLFTGRNLVCVRGERRVFAGLDFAVDAGGALVLAGANGSGKSSLLRLVAGRVVVGNRL